MEHNSQVSQSTADRKTDRRAGPGKPTGMRDRAMLELLYATGIRVTELIQLRLSNLDMKLGLVRVTGKGNKQRLVPVHATALDAISRYTEIGRPALLRASSSPQLFVTARGGAMTQAGFLGQRQSQRQEGRYFPQSFPARPAAYLCHSPPRRRGRPAQRAGYAGSRRSFHHGNLHTRRPRASARNAGRPPSESLN